MIRSWTPTIYVLLPNKHFLLSKSLKMLQPKTFLSPYVSELVNLVTWAATDSSAQLSSCLDDRRLLDFGVIYGLLPPSSSAVDNGKKSTDWYRAAVAALGPVWAEVAAAAAAAFLPAVLSDCESAGLLAWAGCDLQQLQKLCPQLSPQLREDAVGVLETILGLCPLLERGLGNVLASSCSSCNSFNSCSSSICHVGEPVPALLRDILAARQLEHILGRPAVTFLQVSRLLRTCFSYFCLHFYVLEMLFKNYLKKIDPIFKFMVDRTVRGVTDDYFVWIRRLFICLILILKS